MRVKENQDFSPNPDYVESELKVHTHTCTHRLWDLVPFLGEKAMFFKLSRKGRGLVEPLRPHWVPTAYVPGLGWHWAKRRGAGRDETAPDLDSWEL